MSAEEFVSDHLKGHPVTVFSKKSCPYCVDVKELLYESGIDYHEVLLDQEPNMREIQNYLYKVTGARSVPRVFIGDKCIGGYDNTVTLHDGLELVPMVLAAGGVVRPFYSFFRVALKWFLRLMR